LINITKITHFSKTWDGKVVKSWAIKEGIIVSCSVRVNGYLGFLYSYNKYKYKTRRSLACTFLLRCLKKAWEQVPHSMAQLYYYVK
jgi:hypothetical protein